MKACERTGRGRGRGRGGIELGVSTKVSKGVENGYLRVSKQMLVDGDDALVG